MDADADEMADVTYVDGPTRKRAVEQKEYSSCLINTREGTQSLGSPDTIRFLKRITRYFQNTRRESKVILS